MQSLRCSCRSRCCAKRPHYRLHPALGDALLQVVAGAVPLEEDGSFSPFTYMPVGIRSVRVLSKIEDYRQPLFVYAVRTSQRIDAQPGTRRSQRISW